jgi:hypothetical protein
MHLESPINSPNGICGETPGGTDSMYLTAATIIKLLCREQLLACNLTTRHAIVNDTADFFG